jgi:hypothetical protein
MNDLDSLTSEDYKQLINYYKNKSQETEFNFLLLQIKTKKEIELGRIYYEEELKKHQEAHKEDKLNLIKSFDKKNKQNKSLLSKPANKAKLDNKK